MRYADLKFVLHGFVPAEEAKKLGRSTPVVIEHAVATLLNGRSVSVIRGMKSAGSLRDFETCRMFDWERAGQPIQHATIESVQEELDAVAALPPLGIA